MDAPMTAKVGMSIEAAISIFGRRACLGHIIEAIIGTVMVSAIANTFAAGERRDQLDRLRTELLRIRGTTARHGHILPAGPDGPECSSVHKTGGRPVGDKTAVAVP
jgi:hypothetical protein